MSIDLFSDEALAAERAKLRAQADDLKTLRADAWKEIRAHHPDLAEALKTLKREFSGARMASESVKKFARIWRSRNV